LMMFKIHLWMRYMVSKAHAGKVDENVIQALAQEMMKLMLWTNSVVVLAHLLTL